MKIKWGLEMAFSSWTASSILFPKPDLDRMVSWFTN